VINAVWNFLTGTLPAFLQFVSNALTVTLGIITLVALYRHRGELSVFLRVLATSRLNERFRRIRETLTELEHLNYEDKPTRPEIKALLGKLTGHIRGLRVVELDPLCIQIEALLQKPATITEARKRAIIHELDGHLDNISATATTALVKRHE